MVFFNYALRKLNAKIVYYGPGLCGKTTNLQWIHDNFEGGEKGKMVSLATEGDRTIFFDLLPLEIGTIRGMDVTLQLYTVPGQVHYNSTRQLVLRGADGVVFVGDSQRTMRGSNQESLVNLEENLKLQGINLAEFPHVLQFNKRDLGDLMSTEEMDGHLNRFDAPIFEAVAVQGIGVQDTLQGIVRLVMRSLRDRYEAYGSRPQPTAPSAAGSWPVQGATPSGLPAAPSFSSPAAPPVAVEPEYDASALETRPPTGGPWAWHPAKVGTVQVDEPTDVYATGDSGAREQRARSASLSRGPAPGKLTRRPNPTKTTPPLGCSHHTKRTGPTSKSPWSANRHTLKTPKSSSLKPSLLQRSTPIPTSSYHRRTTAMC